MAALTWTLVLSVCVYLRPEIKRTCRIHLEIRFNLPSVLLDFQSFTKFGKSHFLNLAKGLCGGNIRKRFELRVMAACFGAQMKTSFGTQSIISSTRTTSSRTLFSTGRASALAKTWVWFLNLDSGEVVETKL